MPLVGFAFTDAALDFLSTMPGKPRRQVIKKARLLHTTPHPPGSKKLQGIETEDGEPIYRERSGDYRILYVVRTLPNEVLILDIDLRKDVYKMPHTKSVPADEMRMKESEFDDVMRGAIGVAQPLRTVLNQTPPQVETAAPEAPKRKPSRRAKSSSA